jgi:hypothetical protein
MSVYTDAINAVKSIDAAILELSKIPDANEIINTLSAVIEEIEDEYILDDTL